MYFVVGWFKKRFLTSADHVRPTDHLKLRVIEGIDYLRERLCAAMLISTCTCLQRFRPLLHAGNDGGIFALGSAALSLMVRVGTGNLSCKTVCLPRTSAHMKFAFFIQREVLILKRAKASVRLLHALFERDAFKTCAQHFPIDTAVERYEHLLLPEGIKQ